MRKKLGEDSEVVSVDISLNEDDEVDMQMSCLLQVVCTLYQGA